MSSPEPSPDGRVVADAPGGAGRPDRATVGSVAARAGVSRQTVSNVLNAPHRVRPDTAARVRAVIAELGYRPHHAAQQLRTRRSHLLGMRIHQAPDPTVFDRFLHEITEAAGRRDHRIILYTATDDDGEITQYPELLDRWNIDGLLLSYTHTGDRRTAHLTGLDVPFVTFGRPWDNPGAHSWVDVDGAAGTHAATTHLIGLGHTGIGFVGWPEGSDVGEDRLAGWSRALREAGLPVPRPARCVNDVGEATSAALRLLRRSDLTALVCASDLIGIGALAAGSIQGRRAGVDLAVIGFDDSDQARGADLSSIRQPLRDVAEHCVRLVLAQIDRGDQRHDPEHILLPPSLELRRSTQPR